MIIIETPFTIQNTEDGRAFIKQLRLLGARLKLRGRHPLRKQLAAAHGLSHARVRQDVPLKYATHFSVYSY